MKATIQTTKEVEIVTLRIRVGVRYWEDGTVNGVEDTDGRLIPCRNGDAWEPVIDIETGVIVNWTKGVTAYVHYKVCDDGSYYLKDATGRTVMQRLDDYVPDCMPGEHYGDYIIINIDADGKIEGWDSEISTAGFEAVEQ